jgi:glycosyltransferase involved in cell wall biosynthesis
MDYWLDDHPCGGRLRITGYSPRLWGLMKRAAAFVSPSLFEGSPNVVLEAMAAGVPLVVSDIPEHREILDEQGAVFVNPRSPDEVAGAIVNVLDQPAAAATRVAAARRRVEQFGLRRVAQRYTEVYRDVLSARGAN